jgi:hypothetical protein
LTQLRWLVAAKLAVTWAGMPDDKSKQGAADRSRINVNESHEVNYWTKELGVTKEKLEAAVKKVGVMVADVRKHLAK